VERANLYLIQHSDAEHLGLIEDHLEGRGVRFRYLRPHTGGDWAVTAALPSDGLILLGGGPWGSVSGPLLPSLQAEVELARAYLERGQPVVGFGLGAQILALAGGGRSEPAALRLTVGEARRVRDDALSGHMPARFPQVVYGRDRALPPDHADILAVADDGLAAVFQIGTNALGFSGHPGMKTGMVEDYVMASEDVPKNMGEGLEKVRAAQAEIAEALSRIMVGVMKLTGWMQPR
jgi:GMP synthase-like glutamine amidotransferase